MRLLAQIAETVFWCALWVTIPSVLLYPAMLWMLNHTHYSEHFLIQGYVIGIGVLFLPTAFLVDFLYRKFFPKKRPSN
jgi:ABC-type dipeptide/oligopeptide/nickel transport system permease component